MYITKHAYDRARKRFGWKSKVLDKMALKALTGGISHKDTKGILCKYISKLWFDHRSANNIKIYGENVYLFNNETLITIFRLENNLIKCLQYCK